ncbi:hypothetical protein L3Q82_021162 [Scortum barcoo]|uniref:Uncharacterized protein n=1 Tax=Scortum barcoo TaxID=214431 RepID=A0ACB8X4W8_9TELE|nr:hypothetical protein L3Q82_021162 [Scortum barcoo]
MEGGAAADRAEDIRGWERMSATYAGRRVTGLPTVPEREDDGGAWDAGTSSEFFFKLTVINSRPVAYFSAKLDPVAAGHPRCLRAVAAAEKALLASRDIVGYAHVTLLVPHVRCLSFSSSKRLRTCPQQDDWFTSIDLKDAYFHVPIIPKHRRFLRFSFQGIQYQYNRLPFRYSLAPRTFSRCVETVLEPLRRTGMRVLFYLDDLLLLARSKEEAAVQTMTLVVHLSNLGFAINWKSSPLPSQQVIYLGVELDSVSMRAQLSQQREGALTALLHLITPHNVVTALSVMQLLGMMSAGHVTVPLGLLHMRRLQRWFIRLCVDPIRQRRCMVSDSPLSWAGPGLLGESTRSISGGSPGQSDVTHFRVHRRFPLGVGGDVLDGDSGGSMASAYVSPHKRTGAAHGVE